MAKSQLQKDLERLAAAGVETSCRCPKPCMMHSTYYRAEALRRLKRVRCSKCGHVTHEE